MIKQESKYMSSPDMCKEVGEVFSLAEAWPEEVEMKGNLYDLILDQKQINMQEIILLIEILEQKWTVTCNQVEGLVFQASSI